MFKYVCEFILKTPQMKDRHQQPVWTESNRSLCLFSSKREKLSLSLRGTHIPEFVPWSNSTFLRHPVSAFVLFRLDMAHAWCCSLLRPTWSQCILHVTRFWSAEKYKIMNENECLQVHLSVLLYKRGNWAGLPINVLCLNTLTLPVRSAVSFFHLQCMLCWICVWLCMYMEEWFSVPSSFPLPLTPTHTHTHT